MSSPFTYHLFIILNILSTVCTTLSNGSIDEQTTKIGARDEEESFVSRTKANLAAGGLLLASADGPPLNLFDPIDRKLLDILNRDSPEMRPSRDYKDFSDITVDVSKRAWSLLHERTRLAVRERFRIVGPILKEILISANVSIDCLNSLEQVQEGAQRLESWAIKMIAAWANFPPSAMFEGTYSEIGSYHSCVNIPKNSFIDHAHYCTFAFRPVLPSPKRYQLVIDKPPKGLLDMFEYSNTSMPNIPVLSNRSKDAFRDILDHASYFHYVYFKLGSCWPIQCSPFDVKRVSKLVAKRNLFMNGPVKCFSKYSNDYEQPGSIETNLVNGSEPIKRKLTISVWDLNDGIYISKPHLNNAQKIALFVVGSIFLFICSMTVIDILINRIPNLIKYALVESTETPSVQTTTNGPLKLGRLETDCKGDENGDMKVSKSEQVGKKSSATNDLPLRANNQKYLPVATSDQNNTRNPANKKYRRSNNIDKSFFMNLVEDCSIITSCNDFITINESQLRNILCLDGIRCMTMAWIILTHTMMYNDWSAFARTRDIERSVTSLAGQPIFNGSYLVDTFFLMAGLLSSYTAFKHCRGLAAKFSAFFYIFNRWLRLTPQIFFVSMLFIIVPIVSDGPHWIPMSNEYSENCVENWWINTLHLQAFYKTEKMCNFVTWWISIDFFYHLFAIAIIWVLLSAGHKSGFLTLAIVIVGHVICQTIRHYQLSLPPNILSTIPQTGAMWTEMVQGFYWRPYSHSVPFFLGFYLGYVMALKKKLLIRCLNRRSATLGWSITAIWFIIQSFSQYLWVTGQADYPRLISTIYNIVCPILWSICLCWVIVACHYGYGGIVNSLLTNRIFIILGRASYLIYLSHFQIMFLFFGNLSVLLEPTTMIMFYVILGNIVLSASYGVFLCIVFELPWLKAQKKFMQFLIR